VTDVSFFFRLATFARAVQLSMALVDSAASFEKRCNELQDGLHDVFSDSGITTFSSLAFAVGTPQSAPADDEMQRFTDRLMGGPATLADLSVVKRIHFEAVTLVMVDIQQHSTAQDLSEPGRSLPFVEKQRRLAVQQAKITGISHRHEQQASHALIDACFQMVENGSLVYLAPSKCGSRDQEIQQDAKTKQKQLVTIEQGALKAVANPSLAVVDVGTELRLMYALQRRGLAFDLVGLMSWDTHAEWSNELFRALMAEAVPNFNPISIDQLLRADQELFLLLAAEHTGSLKAASVDQDPPLDQEVRRLMNDPRINVHLTPIQRIEKRAAPAGAPLQGSPNRNNFNKKQKVDTPKTPSQVPAELQGLHTKTKDGKPICWHKNMKKGCRNATKNGRCRFGYHTCMKCLKPGHGAADCHGEKAS
jgi:hypothetical protein